MAQRKLYLAHVAMLQRCNNPNHKAYKNYGGRGITVDPRWRKFDQFLADMGDRPDGHQLDRIDNDGPYSPENCRWVPQAENLRNKRQRKDGRLGIQNVVQHKDGVFRVRVLREKMVIFDKCVTDFFEACCLAKRFHQGV